MTLEIFIPYWGDPGLLRQTVESVRAQDDPEWRLTVLNDRYPDDSVPAYFESLDDLIARAVEFSGNLELDIMRGRIGDVTHRRRAAEARP